MIYAGLAVGVVAIAAGITFATENQKNYVSEDAVLAPAAEQGSFTPESGMGPTMNKEQWHEDPFGDLAAKVRSDAGK